MATKTDLWTTVDRYLAGLLLPDDPDLAAALAANAEAGLPAIDVSPLQGQLLTLLLTMSGARRVLEIGTLGAYSTICMARALPANGRIVTLEREPRHAAVARANLERAGVWDCVDLRVGAALQTLPALEAEASPFDFVFIDADKENNAAYLDWAIRLGRPGTAILIDNTVRDGDVADPGRRGDAIVGTRRALEAMGKDDRLVSTAVQTVGVKGHDGFALAVMR